MFHKSSTSFILSVLAFADCLMVNTGLLRFWIAFAFDVDIRTFSSSGCKFHIMLTYYIHQVLCAHRSRHTVYPSYFHI